jgi:tRNA 5-methylaminomethyl-2-thiouridine biosynthesis bifunctional protein
VAGGACRVDTRTARVKSAGLVPGRIERDGDATPFSPDYADVYHPSHGALAQARHVFLAGNGLPGRWRGRDRFVVLETGFGLGSNFLATWSAWLADPQRCRRLFFISVEAHPLRRQDLAAIDRDPAIAALAAELLEIWPPPTRNLHRLPFSDGRVQLLLLFDDVRDALPQITASVDAFYLDGFAPARNPAMWEPRLYKAMARIAAADATAATWSVAGAVEGGLRAAGFETRRGAGIGGKREITLASFAPRFEPRSLPRSAHRRAEGGDERVVVVGAGLAGCAVAWALAEQGLRSLLLERNAVIAGEGSGQAAGLFHGVVHRDDGRHARFNRAAALEVRRHVATAIAQHGVRGSVAGLLRLDPNAASSDMQSTLDRQALPNEFVRALDAGGAGALAGLALAAPAWHFPQGGWVEPRGLARSFVERSSGLAETRFNVEVSSIRRVDGRWHLLAADGRVLESASVVVLANAGDAQRLIGNGDWALERRRGQSSGIDVSRWPDAAALRLPVAGSGYLLPALDDTLWFGATSQADDGGADVRIADHAANLARLRGLLAKAPHIDAADAVGRTGFRWSSSDRLPIVGALPLASVVPEWLEGIDLRAVSSRPEHPRFAPRAPGLFVVAALGSRGIACSALAAQCVAAAITGAPAPLEADLLDAIDPARFASRAWRRRAAALASADGSGQPPDGPIVGGSAGA